jgi:hypothetical protein
MELTKMQKFAVGKWQSVGIEIDFLDNMQLRITQKTNYNGYILTKKELVDRAKSVFPDHIIKPVRYSLDVADIDAAWILDKMKAIGLNTNDLVAQTTIDKSSLSLMLSGDRKMNKSVKALFYYYFLTYDLNRELRD